MTREQINQKISLFLTVEAFFLALNGVAGWDFVFGTFIVPVLFGNIIGGTALFGLISYGQVMHEIKG